MRHSINLQNTFKHYILCQVTLIFHLFCSNYFITRKVIKISRENGLKWISHQGYLEKQNCNLNIAVYKYFAVKYKDLIGVFFVMNSRKYQNMNKKITALGTILPKFYFVA